MNIKPFDNDTPTYEVKKFIALQVRKQINAILNELLSLEEEMTFK